MDHLTESSPYRDGADATTDFVNGLLGDIAALTDEVTHLHRAMEDRAVVEQARGMLMLAYRISDEAAFGLLSRLSRNTGVTVMAVARTIVETNLAVPATGDGTGLSDGAGQLP